MILGGKCALCGSKESLTFDCRVPAGGAHHKLSTDQRMCFYRQQFRFGNLQILCHACNSKKGAAEQNRYQPIPLPRELHAGARAREFFKLRCCCVLMTDLDLLFRWCEL